MTVVLQVTGITLTLWLVALGMGAVVVAVVATLLGLLARLTKAIDDNVTEVWEQTLELAANTATAERLQRTTSSAQRLRDELERHRRLLEGQ